MEICRRGEAADERGAVLVTRGGIEESRHVVRYAAAHVDGRLLAAAGDIDMPTYMRSSAKPLICAVVVASGAGERYGLSDRELAVAAGSHSGEPFHVAAVRSILAKIGLDETALACGPHAPLHAASAQALAAAGEPPRSIHNNCSGKHAAILALAMHRRAGAQGYLRVDHPAQVEILAACARLLDIPRDSMFVGIDGCGIPAIAVPMRAAARFYARVSDPGLFPDPWSAAIERVKKAMIANPEYVGGSERFDTALMCALAPDVLAKGGAEGYHAVSVSGRALGMCLKIVDGNPRAVSPAVLARLTAFGVVTAKDDVQLGRYRSPAVTNHAGTVVGEIIAQPVDG
ncbi:MAG: asparaginase [Candidatus Eremiobacteraeota bacterium]|nr:asparaginase [Candidatus Eremiobacteraeota bacterium]